MLCCCGGAHLWSHSHWRWGKRSHCTSWCSRGFLPCRRLACLRQSTLALIPQCAVALLVVLGATQKALALVEPSLGPCCSALVFMVASSTSGIDNLRLPRPSLAEFLTVAFWAFRITFPVGITFPAAGTGTAPLPLHPVEALALLPLFVTHFGHCRPWTMLPLVRLTVRTRPWLPLSDQSLLATPQNPNESRVWQGLLTSRVARTTQKPGQSHCGLAPKMTFHGCRSL
jgi:hypothetical protein